MTKGGVRLFDEKANMARFLETWAPLRKFREPVADNLGNRASPNLNMHCPRCVGTQTFVHEGDPSGSPCTRVESPSYAEVWRYRCAKCRAFGRLFFLEYGKDKTGTLVVRKLGQKPEWEAPVDARLAGLLGEHEPLFKRGLDSEKSGYGIGAVAYYRRVVEDMIGGLLDRIPILLDGADRERYLAVLEEVHRAHDAQSKIELVKDLLPARLRPDGINPLDVLHGELSVGLHGKSDEDCLDDAEAVRSALSYVIVELARAEDDRREFTAGMRKLLEKRAGKQTASKAPESNQ
jgi:hypothetical protein